MQTKKRAKPVKFGKKLKEAEEKKHEVHHEEPREHAAPKEKPEPETTISVTETSVDTTIITEEPHSEPEQTEKEEKETPEEEIQTEADSFDEVTEEPTEEIVLEKEQPEEQEETIVTEKPEKKTEEKKDEEIDQLPASFSEHTVEVSEETITQDPDDSDSLVIKKQSSVFSDATFEAEASPKKNFLFTFLITALVAFLLGLGGILGVTYLMQHNNFSVPNFQVSLPWMTEPTPTPKPEPTEVPTPTEALDLSAYSIEVQNGTGVSGAAAVLQKSLVADGFTVSGVGNADASTYTKTEISVREGIPDAYVVELRKTLEKSYVLDDETQAPASQKADVVIIIGKETN